MNPLKSSLYCADIRKSVRSLQNIVLPEEKVFFITGATGLIGSALIDLLVYLTESMDLGWKIICGVHNKEKFAERFETYTRKPYFLFTDYDLKNVNSVPEDIDFIIHCAGNAYPAAFVSRPVETLEDGMKGLTELLRYSSSKKCRLVYVSSGEVYGQVTHTDSIKENEYGFIDILNPRSAYPIGKRASETLCSSYCSEYEADCVIARLCHTYGPTASENDNRISTAFMFDAAYGRDLIMKSGGEQVRSYIYCLDCATGILATTFAGITGEAYNIANKDSVFSVMEFSMLLAELGGVKLILDSATIEEKRQFNPMKNAVLSSKKIETLGWRAAFHKEESIRHSIEIIKELL